MFRPIPVIALLVAVAALIGTISSSTAADTPTASVAQQTYQGKTIMQWHSLAVRRRVDRDWLQKRLGVRVRQVRALARVKLPKPRDVAYAIHLASTVYGVSERDMNAVASCESGHYLWARNGQYRSIFQEGPMFESGRFGRAGFSVWDPIASAMTAAETVAREGWSQWECKP